MHVRNRLQLSPRPAPATSARFRQLCDGRSLHSTFLSLLPPPPSLHQCSARRRRNGRARHRPSPKLISKTASNAMIPLTGKRRSRRRSMRPLLRLGRQGRTRNLGSPFRAPSRRGRLFRPPMRRVRPIACLRSPNLCSGYGPKFPRTTQPSPWGRGRSRAHPQEHGRRPFGRRRDSPDTIEPPTGRPRCSPLRPRKIA